MISLWPTLLLWWNGELTPTERSKYRFGGVYTLLDALKERFTSDAATATKRVTEGRLRLIELAGDKNLLRQYVHTKLRYARTMVILNADNRNWHGVMTQIWSGTELGIKQYLRPPARHGNLVKYLQIID